MSAKRFQFFTLLVIVLFCSPVLAYTSADEKSSKSEVCDAGRQYTFSWPLIESCNWLPRGGTTKGKKVSFDLNPSVEWKRLQTADLTTLERDRRAILAMTGAYRASFEFLEVIGYQPNFVPDKPYQSWATEYVYLVEDTGTFISLQHIMVMFFEGDKGKITGPMVMKHWRQDWQYQPKTILEYQGGQIWQLNQVPRNTRKGTWSQSVYQVDDSPRYAATGKWMHNPAFSKWESGLTWRPLPRREFSVRQDYHVLEGINRHAITSTGWVHEQDNHKAVFTKPEQHIERDRRNVNYLSKELGLNRYERIIEHDFSAGDDYWRHSAPFWADVRSAWQSLIKKYRTLNVEKTSDGIPLFMPLFEYAESLKSKPYNKENGRLFIQSTLERYVSPVIRASK